MFFLRMLNNFSLINHQDVWRDLPPIQCIELFNKMYLQVCCDPTSSYADRFKSSQKYLTRPSGSRTLCEISTNINVQLEVTLKTMRFRVEHSSAHQRLLERDQQGADYHPGLPLMKASALWRLTNSMSAAQWLKLEIHMSRCAKCANQFSEETMLSRRNHTISGSPLR